jgi:hypothetical protein
MKELIDFDKHMKCDIRNNDPVCDFHDVVKLLIMRILSRKHPNTPIYSEVKVGKTNDITDVQAIFKDAVYNFEIQRIITNDWMDKIEKRDLDTDTNTIIIPLLKLNVDSYESIKRLVSDVEAFLI